MSGSCILICCVLSSLFYFDYSRFIFSISVYRKVFTELINYVVNVGTDSDFCVEAIMQVLLKCLDRPECRELVRFDDLLAILTAPFLDFHYVPHNADFTSHQTANNQSGFYGQPSSNNDYKRQKSNQAAATSDAEPKMSSVLMACSAALLTFLNR